MRSDFYGLPYAARMAIRRGETAQRRARRSAGAASEAKRLREALEELRSRRQQVIDSYERNGPQWTSEQGSEMFDASYVVESARDDVELARTALQGESRD